MAVLTAPQAHRRVFDAIRRGELVRQPCEVCGSEPADAHHADYSEPLVVRWFCRRHHQQHHAALRGSRPPIMIRADIVSDEWHSLRYLAIGRGLTVQALVGQLIREHLAAQKD